MPQSDDLYIRKDVFDARMDRLEALIDKKLTQSESNMNMRLAQMERKIDVLSERVDQNFAYLNMRIDSISSYVGWEFAIVAILVALLGLSVTFAPSIWGFMKRQKRPKQSVTKREIESIFNSSLDKYLEKITNIQK